MTKQIVFFLSLLLVTATQCQKRGVFDPSPPNYINKSNVVDRSTPIFPDPIVIEERQAPVQDSNPSPWLGSRILDVFRRES